MNMQKKLSQKKVKMTETEAIQYIKKNNLKLFRNIDQKDSDCSSCFVYKNRETWSGGCIIPSLERELNCVGVNGDYFTYRRDFNGAKLKIFKNE